MNIFKGNYLASALKFGGLVVVGLLIMRGGISALLVPLKVLLPLGVVYYLYQKVRTGLGSGTKSQPIDRSQTTIEICPQCGRAKASRWASCCS